jgi:hypothetical protein
MAASSSPTWTLTRVDGETTMQDSPLVTWLERPSHQGLDARCVSQEGQGVARAL